MANVLGLSEEEQRQMRNNVIGLYAITLLEDAGEDVDDTEVMSVIVANLLGAGFTEEHITDAFDFLNQTLENIHAVSFIDDEKDPGYDISSMLNLFDGIVN